MGCEKCGIPGHPHRRGREKEPGNRSFPPIEQERNCDLCDNMNTKNDPAITRKEEEEEEEEEDAALGLGFSPPAEPSRAEPRSLLLRLVEIGDHGGKKTPAESKKMLKSRALGPTRGLRRPHERRVSRRRWCGERGPVLCGNSIRVSFFLANFVMSSQSGDHPENYLA